MFIRPKKPVPEPFVRRTLSDLGYRIDEEDGMVRSIENGEPFAFDQGPSKKQAMELYNTLIHEASRDVYRIMTDTLGMESIAVPSKDQPHCNIYATPGALSQEKLVVLVTGNSTFGGVWAWDVLVKSGLGHGSVVEYVRDCGRRGVGVLVLNPNENIVAPDGVGESFSSYLGRGTAVGGSGTADEHVGYVWSRFLRDGGPRRIGFVAYNTAGMSVVNLLRYDYARFVDRVAGVAFIDSTHTTSGLGSGSVRWLGLGAKMWETFMAPSSQPFDSRAAGCLVVAAENTTQSRGMTPSLCRTSVLEYLVGRLDEGPVVGAAGFGPGQEVYPSFAAGTNEAAGEALDTIDAVDITQSAGVERSDGYVGWD
ncbi:hypothetical protein GGF46_000159 [Coemansia sp. RSA 552]|nr:hypothetical protein GGF46_000159 [Coemansia sp. RSA 552]